MFKGRRNRAPAGAAPLGARAPPVNTVAAANSAALQAFMASQNATKLSAAAAATAVRSHTPPATNVAEVQTKRTMRRTSITSNTSAPGRGTPQRRLSSGSMADRTFREPSPGRAPSQTADEEPPPLPAIPRATPSPSKKTKAPVEATNGRVSSPAVVSDTNAVSAETRVASRPKQIKTTAPTTNAHLPLATDAPSSPIPGGRSSVNFSRPMSPVSPPASPTLKKNKPAAAAGAAPSTGPIMTPNEAEQILHGVVEAGTKPVRRKEKAIAPQITEGSHLQSGATGGGKPKGTALGAAAAAVALANKSSSTSQKSSSPPSKSKVVTSSSDDESSVKGAPAKGPATEAIEPTRASGTLMKQPSVVREDREGEELAEKGLESNALRNTEGTPTPKRKTKPKTKTTSSSEAEKLELDTGSASKRESVSPGRAARFSGVVLEPPGQHNPPGRSASPSKSAMKHSPSSRNASPSDLRGQVWNRPGFTPSEASDTPSASSEDVRRKKRFSRVSFDVEPTIVGEAAEVPMTGSPVIASPQHDKVSKRNWFSFGREKSGRPGSSGTDGEDVMQPVPTLPSFGSVRGKRDSLVEDEREPSPARALPRVTSARAKHVTKAPSPDLPPTTTETAPKEAKAIETQDLESTPVKPAHDPNEPLPPEVTSVEGTGQYDFSDVEDGGSTVGQDTEPAQIADVGAKPEETFPIETTAPEASELKSVAAAPPPVIELQPATPRLDTEEKLRDSYMQVPGEWGKDSEISTTANGSVPEDSHVASVLPAAGEKDEPNGSAAPQAVRTETPIAPRASTESGSSSTTSVYSDAEEFDGDGFGSINAIVDSPAPKTKNVAAAKAPESPTAEKVPPSPVKAQVPLKSALKKDSSVTPTPATAAGGTKTSQKATTMRKSMRDASPIASSTSPNRMRASMRAPDTREGPMRMMSTPTPVKTTQASAKTTPASAKTTPASAKNTPTPPKPTIAEPRGRGREPTRAAASPIPPSTGGRLQKKQRPMSTLQSTTAPLSAASQPRQRPVSMGADGRVPKTEIPAVPLPTSKKFAGYDSDSDSSFKRARRPSRPSRASSESRVTMRRSMRANPPQQTRKDPRSTGFGTPKSTASTSTPRPTSMRTTMRSAQAAPPPPERQRSRTPTRALFSRSSKAPPVPTEPVPTVTKRFKSRFADSDSDDDVPASRTFRSRFADSSDEDEPAELDSAVGMQTTIRTSKASEIDSLPADAPERTFSFSKETPLSTKTMRSGEKDIDTAKESVTNKDIDSPKSPNSTFSLRRDGEKRRSILDHFSLGRRKDRGSKVAKVDIESAARRDTPLERSRAARQNIPEVVTPSTSTVDQVADGAATPTPATAGAGATGSATGSAKAAPFASKVVPVVPPASNGPVPPRRPMSPPRSVSKLLQRRQTSDGWPTPPPEPASSGRPAPPVRPTTSDGTGSAKRRVTSLGARALGGSRPSTPPSFPKTMRGPKTDDDAEKEVVPDTPLSGTESSAQRGQKRKRFQGLRKAFGMKD